MTSGPAQRQPPRLRDLLAEVAQRAALATDGVAAVAGDPRGLHTTVTASARVAGVSVVAEAADRYAVVVSVVARIVPLQALAARIRKNVIAESTSAGLREHLGAVDIRITDVINEDDGHAHAPVPVLRGAAA